MAFRINPWVVMSVLVCLGFIGTACAQEQPGKDPQLGAMPEKTIEIVLQQHSASLMSLPDVVGTAQGECSGKPSILVLVAKKTQELSSRIPSVIEGYIVSVVETGEFRKFEAR